MSVHLIYGNGLSTLQRGPRASESPEMWCQQLEHTLSADMWSMDSLGVRGKWELSHEGMLFSHSSVPGIWSRCYMNRPNVLWELLTIGTFQTFPYFFAYWGAHLVLNQYFTQKWKCCHRELTLVFLNTNGDVLQNFQAALFHTVDDLYSQTQKGSITAEIIIWYEYLICKL